MPLKAEPVPAHLSPRTCNQDVRSQPDQPHIAWFSCEMRTQRKHAIVSCASRYKTDHAGTATDDYSVLVVCVRVCHQHKVNVHPGEGPVHRVLLALAALEAKGIETRFEQRAVDHLSPPKFAIDYQPSCSQPRFKMKQKYNHKIE